jgi:hypothetical protein
MLGIDVVHVSRMSQIAVSFAVSAAHSLRSAELAFGGGHTGSSRQVSGHSRASRRASVSFQRFLGGGSPVISATQMP